MSTFLALFFAIATSFCSADSWGSNVFGEGVGTSNDSQMGAPNSIISIVTFSREFDFDSCSKYLVVVLGLFAKFARHIVTLPSRSVEFPPSISCRYFTLTCFKESTKSYDCNTLSFPMTIVPSKSNSVSQVTLLSCTDTLLVLPRKELFVTFHLQKYWPVM